MRMNKMAKFSKIDLVELLKANNGKLAEREFQYYFGNSEIVKNWLVELRDEGIIKFNGNKLQWELIA